MRRLTHHLHAAYTSHHAYYSASTLGGACGAGWPAAACMACWQPHFHAGLPAAEPAGCHSMQGNHACPPAAAPGPAGLTHADQRITEDVERFAHTACELSGVQGGAYSQPPCGCCDRPLSQRAPELALGPSNPGLASQPTNMLTHHPRWPAAELYSYTFKPLLDVVLFTRSLSRVMGYKRQFALYGVWGAETAGLPRGWSRAGKGALFCLCAAAMREQCVPATVTAPNASLHPHLSAPCRLLHAVRTGAARHLAAAGPDDGSGNSAGGVLPSRAPAAGGLGGGGGGEWRGHHPVAVDAVQPWCMVCEA